MQNQETLLPVQIDENLLPVNELNKLKELTEELAHAYKSRQIFRTDTEARISVLDDLHHPTKAAKYWQSIREQTVMLEQLSLLSFEYRKNEVQIKRCQRKLETLRDLLDVEEAEIEMEELLFKRVSMKTVASDRAREINMWSVIKSELDDGSFDKDNVNTHQLLSYTTQFIIRAANSDPKQMSGAELDNLVGQLKTAIQRCVDLGLTKELSALVPPQVLKDVQLLLPFLNLKVGGEV